MTLDVTSRAFRNSTVEYLIERPERGLAVLCGLQIVLWTLAAALSHDAPPLDVVEGYMWGHEHVIGTYKHPGLPGWLLEASRRLTGAVGWPAYLISETFVGVTFLFVFLLGRDGFASAAGDERHVDALAGQKALAGALLLTTVYYFSWPTPEFNHNIAQMPCWAGLAYVLWRASNGEARAAHDVPAKRTAADAALITRLSGDERFWWIAVGLFGVLGMYAKFSTVVILVAAVSWILVDERARAALLRSGPWLGLLVFSGGVTPLMLWLFSTDFLPYSYALDRGVQFGEPAFTFLVEQVLAILGVVVALGVAGLLGKVPFLPAAPFGAAQSAQRPSRRPLSLSERWAALVAPRDARFTRFLLFMTIVPVLVTVLGSLISGVGVKGMWGVPMLNLVGLIAIALTSAVFSQAGLGRLLRISLIVLVTLPVAYAASIYGAPSVGIKLKRQNWPQAEIASRMRTIFADATGLPLRIVAGDSSNWVSGLVGLSGGAMPSMFTNAQTRVSPWITPQRIAREGALIVWQELGKGPPTVLISAVGALPQKQERFMIPRSRTGDSIVIGYAIVPPARTVP